MRRRKPKLIQGYSEHRAPLLVVRALEDQDVGGAPLHCGVERAQAVGAHDDSRRQPPVAEAIDAADERVYPCPVFVVHLRGLARLRQAVGLIHQQDHPAARPA